MSPPSVTERWIEDVFGCSNRMPISGFGSVLVSCGCCNKLQQSWWLKTAETSSLSVLEARSSASFPRGQIKASLGLHPIQRL